MALPIATENVQKSTPPKKNLVEQKKMSEKGKRISQFCQQPPNRRIKSITDNFLVKNWQYLYLTLCCNMMPMNLTTYEKNPI